MKKFDSIRYQNQLDSLFSRIKDVDDLQLQSHWAKYLCILTSGYLEVAVGSIFGAYSKDKSVPTIYNFVSKKLDGLQNPNMTKIIDLTRSFSSEWGDDLENQTAGEIKDAIDSIYANRNQIAHGRDAGITFHQISIWYVDAKKMINILENIINSNS